ncbi:hypothetical protein GCM10028784_38780 [Myceligenerans cantabricum]
MTSPPGVNPEPTMLIVRFWCTLTDWSSAVGPAVAGSVATTTVPATARKMLTSTAVRRRARAGTRLLGLGKVRSHESVAAVGRGRVRGECAVRLKHDERGRASATPTVAVVVLTPTYGVSSLSAPRSSRTHRS